MQQLPALDAVFLSMETPNTPSHIGGLAILDLRRRLQILGLLAQLGGSLAVLSCPLAQLLQLCLPLGVVDLLQLPEQPVQFLGVALPGLAALGRKRYAKDKADQDRQPAHVVAISG